MCHLDSSLRGRARCPQCHQNFRKVAAMVSQHLATPVQALELNRYPNQWCLYCWLKVCHPNKLRDCAVHSMYQDANCLSRSGVSSHLYVTCSAGIKCIMHNLSWCSCKSSNALHCQRLRIHCTTMLLTPRREDQVILLLLLLKA